MSTEGKRSPLDDLENELLAQPRAPLPAALGDRVLGAVHRELRRDRIREWVSRLTWAAACAVLWLNLSWSVTHRIAEFKPVRPRVVFSVRSLGVLMTPTPGPPLPESWANR